jgi:hypothetical protein
MGVTGFSITQILCPWDRLPSHNNILNTKLKINGHEKRESLTAKLNPRSSIF